MLLVKLIDGDVKTGQYQLVQFIKYRMEGEWNIDHF